MPVELKDIKVDFLSLVSRGANGKRIFWKSGTSRPEGADAVETPLRSVVKSDEKRMVYGVVYSPRQTDTQNEFASETEIEKAAYGFMKGLRLLNVDAQHDFDPKAAYVAESWILKGVDSLFPKEPEGSWAVGIKVEDDALWEGVKKGELAGISMAGYAVKVRKGEDGFLAKMEELLSRLLKGAGGEVGKKGSPEEGAGKGEGGEDGDAEALKKIASGLEAVPALATGMEALMKRVDALEAGTNGKMSKGVDGGSPDDVSFA